MIISRLISIVKLPLILILFIILLGGCEMVGNDITVSVKNCSQDNIRLIMEPLINIHIENDESCNAYTGPSIQKLGVFADNMKSEYILFRSQGGCQGILTIEFGNIDWSKCGGLIFLPYCHERGTIQLTEPEERGNFRATYSGYGNPTVSVTPCPSGVAEYFNELYFD